MHPIDPWGPGPRRPEQKGSTEPEAKSQGSTLPNAEAHQNEDPATRSQSAQHAAHPTKALAEHKTRSDRPSALSRAIGAAKFVLPVVQKVLPLLEGNVASAAANLLTSSPRPVDLEPVKGAIGKLQAEQRTLRGQVTDQKILLNSIEADLSTIKEGIERNSLELRELAEDQLNLRRRLTRLVWMIFILLFLSIGFTILVCIRLGYILRL
jgi:hypothetical protein